MRKFISRMAVALFLAFSRTLKNINLEKSTVTDAIERSFERERKRLAKRKYKNRKFKKRHSYKESFHSLKGSQSKDHRYSNQRTLRRMFTNM